MLDEAVLCAMQGRCALALCPGGGSQAQGCADRGRASAAQLWAQVQGHTGAGTSGVLAAGSTAAGPRRSIPKLASSARACEHAREIVAVHTDAMARVAAWAQAEVEILGVGPHASLMHTMGKHYDSIKGAAGHWSAVTAASAGSERQLRSTLARRAGSSQGVARMAARAGVLRRAARAQTERAGSLAAWS